MCGGTLLLWQLFCRAVERERQLEMVVPLDNWGSSSTWEAQITRTSLLRWHSLSSWEWINSLDKSNATGAQLQIISSAVGHALTSPAWVDSNTTKALWSEGLGCCTQAARIAALFVKRTMPFSNIDLCKVRVPGQLPENYLAGNRAGEASISKKLWLWCWSTRSKPWTSLDHSDKEMKIKQLGLVRSKVV